MKGKQLSLQEVLNLGDGSKVWVEELKERYSELSGVHLIEQNECGAYALDDIIEVYSDDLEFYEWIDEEKESTLIMYGEIIESMANEIARHRYPNKYEYDDELIESIIREFVEEK